MTNCNLKLTCHDLHLQAVRRSLDVVVGVKVVIEPDFAYARTKRIIQRRLNLRVMLVGIVPSAIRMHTNEMLNLRD